MAVNKNALIRYKTLNKCFRHRGRRYFIEDLIDECSAVLSEVDSGSGGVSRRQIFDDIAFMESKAGWNIELERRREGKRIFYRYANPSFTIDNMPLNQVEINELRSAALTLSQFSGMPRFEWLNELLPKLGQGMAAEDASAAIIEFDSNPYLRGIEYLSTLRNAIYDKVALTITYHPYEMDAPYDLILHPYFLKQYNNRWFLFGYNPDKDKYDWNLAIDRIVEIKTAKDKYHPNTCINWRHYFDDMIGVTRPEGKHVQEVILHILGRTGKYIESKPLHSSQRIKWIGKSTLEVKLRLLINYELERELLSYADSIKVIAPIELANNIGKRLSNALEVYRN